ncbi:MAG: NUDIX domain-containing protein [Candidatus Liptonbacteria bacterium]|nr:NUDIX domain-containing protein [Candidatus Liptonbacteria bacterium]
MSRVTSDKTGRKTVAVSALIFDSKCESVLMVRKRPDKNPEGQCGGWGIPTGGVEATETAKMTIVRETESESGYPVQRVIGLLGEYPKGPLHTLLFYLVEVEDFPQAIKERDEIVEARFIPLSEVLQMPYADRKTPQGVYLSVVNRVMDALGTLASTEPEELEDGSEDAAFKPWLRENQELLRAVVGKLTAKGLLVPASA